MRGSCGTEAYSDKLVKDVRGRAGERESFPATPTLSSFSLHVVVPHAATRESGLMLGRGDEGKRVSERRSWLRVDPGVVEAFAGRGPLLGHHLQHGKQEVGEVSGVFVRPAVLLHQHVEQRPRLQLGDVPQLACRGQEGAESVTAQEKVKKFRELVHPNDSVLTVVNDKTGDSDHVLFFYQSKEKKIND